MKEYFSKVIIFKNKKRFLVLACYELADEIGGIQIIQSLYKDCRILAKDG